MPTADRAAACPALHVLNGAMGRDDQGRPLWPSHHTADHPHCTGRCHCHQPVTNQKSTR